MSERHNLINTLKRDLKTHGLTYRDLAKGMGISEASVKRLFAEESFTLERLDQICQLMEIEISDLVKNMEMESRQLTELTEELEIEMVSDIKLLITTFLAINGWSFQEMTTLYQLSDTETIRYLAKLDKLRVIQLLPKNRIKVLVSPNFSWRKNGPIHQFFNKYLLGNFFDSNFDQTGETFKFLSGMLSHNSIATLYRKLEEVAAEFTRLNQEDRRLPLEKRTGFSMALAMRPWRPQVFEKVRR